jgi:Na+/melibiose symporter-like transporter
VTAATVPRLGRGTHLGYALGSIGTAAFGTVPGLLLLYYLTDVLPYVAQPAEITDDPDERSTRLLAGVLARVYRPA